MFRNGLTEKQNELESEFRRIAKLADRVKDKKARRSFLNRIEHRASRWDIDGVKAVEEEILAITRAITGEEAMSKLNKLADGIEEHAKALLARVAAIKDDRVKRRFMNRISFQADAAINALRTVVTHEASLDQYEREQQAAPAKKGKSRGKA